jgi:hypothetical protein
MSGEIADLSGYGVAQRVLRFKNGVYIRPLDLGVYDGLSVQCIYRFKDNGETVMSGTHYMMMGLTHKESFNTANPFSMVAGNHGHFVGFNNNASNSPLSANRWTGFNGVHWHVGASATIVGAGIFSPQPYNAVTAASSRILFSFRDSSNSTGTWVRYFGDQSSFPEGRLEIESDSPGPGAGLTTVSATTVPAIGTLSARNATHPLNAIVFGFSHPVVELEILGWAIARHI